MLAITQLNEPAYDTTSFNMAQESRTLVIDFAARKSGDFVNNFTCRFNDLLPFNKLRLSFAVISNAEMESDQHHAEIQTDTGTGLVSSGVYTLSDLMTAVQTAFIGVGHAGGSVTLNARGFVQISATAPFTLTVGPNSILGRLGFLTDRTAATTQTADILPLRDYHSAVYVHLSIGNRPCRIGAYETPKPSFVIPVDKTPNISATTFVDNRDQKIDVRGQQITDVNVMLADATGRQLDLRGAECIIVLTECDY